MGMKAKKKDPQESTNNERESVEESFFTSPNRHRAFPMKADSKEVVLRVAHRVPVREKKYKSVTQMSPVVEKYFNDADLNDELYSVEALTLACGFTSTQTLSNYEKGEGYEEFHHLIKAAKLKILAQRVSLAMSRKMHPTLFIFLAANNHPQDYKRDPDTKEALDQMGGLKFGGFEIDLKDEQEHVAITENEPD